MNKTDLSSFNNSWYNPGPLFKRALWYCVNFLFFDSFLLPISEVKNVILRLFGANIGKGVIIKPRVNIKYPWKLKVGDHTWIGEGVWIDNLAKVDIGSHVCISQGALLLTGNHNYKKSTFDLMVQGIVLEDGVWIGAKSNVAPGVRAESHAILTMGSTAVGKLEAYTIYQGNPALALRKREMKNEG